MPRRPPGKLTVRQYLAALRQKGLLLETVSETEPEPVAKSKYHARKACRLVDGVEHSFDSRREAARFDELCLAWHAGVIGKPLLQVGFPLVVDGVWVTHYTADFVYVERATRTLVIEDAKGYRTRDYRVRKKLFFALYGQQIREV